MAIPVANTGGPYATIAEGDLPQVVNLDGTGSSVGDGSSITIYAWKLAKPAGSAAVLSDPAASKPTFSADIWGVYAVFLVVTNDIGQTSKTAPREAPDSAFAWIVVEASTSQLVLPASGQRNWTDYVNRAISVLRALKDTFDGHGIADHDTTATGAQLDTLTQGGDATGLHTHGPADLAGAKAGVAALGVIETAEAPEDPAHPQAVLADWVALSAARETSFLVASADEDVFAWEAPIAGSVERFAMQFGDGWNGTLRLYKVSEATYEGLGFDPATDGTLIGTVAPSVTTSRQALRINTSGNANKNVAAGEILYVRKETPAATPADPSRYVSAQIWLLRAGQGGL